MAAHRTHEERRALVAEWQSSDLTTIAFARSRGVSESSLHRWRKRYGALDPTPSFVELVAHGGPAVPSAPDAPSIEIAIAGSDAMIVVRSGADAATLSTVLAAVRDAR